jgi:hypothetical protein
MYNEMSKKKKSFQIPDSVLRTLDEMSSGGFLLFTFDENCLPSVNASFDSPAHSMALVSFVENWSLALKQNHILMTQQGMMSSPRKNKN